MKNQPSYEAPKGIPCPKTEVLLNNIIENIKANESKALQTIEAFYQKKRDKAK